MSYFQNLLISTFYCFGCGEKGIRARKYKNLIKQSQTYLDQELDF